MGAIIYNNKTAKEIAQKMNGKVDYVFVDIEKKINNRLDILVNIERSTKEVINKSIVKNYKPNDLTVNSIENFIQDYFRSNLRGVGGKKILIVGAGNIGSKIGLRLLESGSSIYLTRRDKKKLKMINATLNIIKPVQTKAKSNIIHKDKLKFEDYDVIIGCADKSVKFQKINNFKKNLLLLMLEKTFTTNSIKQLLTKKFQFLTRYRKFFKLIHNSKYQLKIFSKTILLKSGKFRLIKKGILGKFGDIVVDDVMTPKRIIGICGREGLLKNLSIKKYNFLKSKILKSKNQNFFSLKLQKT